ncbi:MAG TPA: site-2 protease family protein [Pyrinomonadaceae bacterium]|nr:site-2 protease family protein [Pyrinomonadaceae bacterium]
MEKVNFGLFFGHLAVYLFVWVFALTTQGALTAWMSNYYGDDTAKNAGRISFSPFVQSDLIGTIILPTISFIIGWMSPGIPFIAWGKRVPINSENWRNPKLAGAMVTLAATFASISIALISFVLLKVLFVTNIADFNDFFQLVLGKNKATEISWFAPVLMVLWYGLVINIALTIFSLLPIPPFSGGAVLFSLLPESFKPVKDFFNQFGLIIALVLMYFVVVNHILLPTVNFTIRLLAA